MIQCTCYVLDGQLYTYATAERLRRATTAERRASESAGAEGAFTASVKDRTLRQRAPMLARRLRGEP